jgi:hypothetical protein
MHITINAAEVDEYVTATVCALLDKHGAGLLPGRDHEAINDLHAEANTAGAPGRVGRHAGRRGGDSPAVRPATGAHREQA